MKLHFAIYPVLFIIGYFSIAERLGRDRKHALSEVPRKPAEARQIDLLESARPNLPSGSRPGSGQASEENREKRFLIDRTLIAKMEFNLIDPTKLELRKPVHEHLGLDQSQIEAINGEIQKFFTDLRKMEAQHSEVIKSETGEPFVRITPYPQAKLRADDFVDAIGELMSDKDRGISFARLLASCPAFGTLGELTEDVSIISYGRPGGNTGYIVERIIRDEEESVLHSSRAFLKDSTANRKGYEALFKQEMN